MKKMACLAIVLFCGFVFASGQVPVATPIANPDSTREVRERVQREQDKNRRFDTLRNGGRRTVPQGSLREVFYERIVPLYRKPTKEELKILAPNDEDVSKYADFLKNEKTGITKLAVDFGCADNPSVVVATPDCMLYTMPGAGSSYSFRINNYRIRRLADLSFTNNTFQTTGVLSHGILVNLGDVSLEQISLQSKGVKFLLDFPPTAEYEQAIETERRLIVGIEQDGFVYRSGLAAEENRTFFLRSIAYRGASLRAVQGVTYNELDFDK
ncbi:MAG TPA: hypothetical protein PKE69_10285, partial [Pyrinomonadaceae bacterium]|nr:hypothetical protein [Pyrinomonadaceae bacterium]